MKIKIKILFLFLLCISTLYGCAAYKEASTSFEAMDTYMTLSIYDKNKERAEKTLIASTNLIKRLDEKLSARSDDSEIALLNKNGQAILSDEIFDLLKEAINCSVLTDGAFDISIYPLIKLWGFGGEPHVPQKEELERAIALVDYTQISIEDEIRRAILGKDQSIDMGAIAKGFATDKVVDLLKNEGITSALLSLGGNIYALGRKTDGSSWNIAIADPRDNYSGYLCTLTAENEAVISSGGYLRNFEENGLVYHHILDPDTGYPAGDISTSVTIISSDATTADALSTGCLVMGREKAFELWEKHKEEFSIIWFEDGKLWITDDLKNRVTLVNVEKVED